MFKMFKLSFIILSFFFVANTFADTPLPDGDHDGVADKFDRCPNTAQLKMLPKSFRFSAAVNPDRLGDSPKAYPVDEYGCELDSDNDGVVNSQDYCPENTPAELSQGVAENGCPKHSDEDGTPDYRDRCPNTARGIKTDQFGCPVKQ